MVGWGFTGPWEESGSYRVLKMKIDSLWFGAQRPMLSIDHTAIRVSGISVRSNPGSNAHFLGDDVWVP